MRHHEIVEGVGIYDCNKDKIGYSKVSVQNQKYCYNNLIIIHYTIFYCFEQLAAVKGIGETIITRTVILAPGISKYSCILYY